MTKTFIYKVNGQEFTDNVAFGKAWETAKEVATKENAVITRTVVNGDNITHEFFAKGGCFLNDRFYDKEKVKIWG